MKHASQLGMGMFLVGVLLLFLLATAARDAQAASILLLEPSLPSGQPVGTTIVWTASTDSDAPMDYQFSVKRQGLPPA